MEAPFVHIKDHYFLWTSKQLPVLANDEGDAMSNVFDDDSNEFKMFDMGTAGDMEEEDIPKTPLVPSIISQMVASESLTPWQIFEKLKTVAKAGRNRCSTTCAQSPRGATGRQQR